MAAKRQKLTQQQKSRIAANQQKRLAKKAKAAENTEVDLSELNLQPGIVISRFGEQVDIANLNGKIFRAFLRQNLGSCVSGDRIRFHENEAGDMVVAAIEPRTSELNRPTPHAGIKTIVANVDQILVVVAPFPDYSSIVLDRYLVACELAHIPTAIVFNKVDLYNPQTEALFQEQKSIYQSIGYPTYEVSCESGKNIEQLMNALKQKENILVGLSGVGKSSLINALMPKTEAVVGAVSENSRLGTHTTTASTLYFLPDGGHIIDSPGIREFGLSHIEKEELIAGFIDLAPLASDCKFRNCSHLNEPGCSFDHAVKLGKVSQQRVENFRKIFTSISGGN